MKIISQLNLQLKPKLPPHRKQKIKVVTKLVNQKIKIVNAVITLKCPKAVCIKKIQLWGLPLFIFWLI